MKMLNGNLKKILFIFSLFVVFFSSPKFSFSQSYFIPDLSSKSVATTDEPIQVNYNGDTIWVERIKRTDESGKDVYFYKTVTGVRALNLVKDDPALFDKQNKYANLKMEVAASLQGVTGQTSYTVTDAKNDVLSSMISSGKIPAEISKNISTAGASAAYNNLGELTQVSGTTNEFTSANFPGVVFTVNENSGKTGFEVTGAKKDGVDVLHNITTEAQFKEQQAKIEAEIEAANQSQIVCKLWSNYFVECLVAKFAYSTVFGISKTFLKLAGTFFDWTVDYTIVKLKANLGDESVINVSWRIFRDLANVLFIFFMIYIAITTIIQGTGKTAEGIKNIIIVAVLINFSLFFTKIVIDVSNTAAVSFYNAIVDKIIAENPLTDKADTTGVLGKADSVLFHRDELIFGDQRTIAEAFISRAGLMTFFDVPEGHLNYILVIKQLILTSIVYAVVAVVLFLASLLLVTRYIILIVVMLLSSLAFGAYILPAFRKKISDQWWSALVGQAFLAPVFLLMIYISLMILSTVPQTKIGENGFGDLDKVASQDVLRLIMVIGTLIFSIKTAKSLSDKAGGMAGAITKAVGGSALGIAAWAGRNTVGAGANMLAKNLEARGALSGFVKRRFEGVAKSSFDVRSSRIGGKVIGESGIDLGKTPKDASYVTDAAARAKAAKKRAESISNKPVDPNNPEGPTHREVYERSNFRKFTGGWSRQVQLKDLAKLKEKAAKIKRDSDALVAAEKTRIKNASQASQTIVDTQQREIDVIKGALAQSIATNNGQEPQLRTRLAAAENAKNAAQQVIDGITSPPSHTEAVDKLNKELAETNLKIENFDKDKEPSPSDLMREMNAIKQAQNKS